MPEACGETEIMAWPDEDQQAQGIYLNMEDDICAGVYEAPKQQIAEAFVRVANGVLNRERRGVPVVVPQPVDATYL